MRRSFAVLLLLLASPVAADAAPRVQVATGLSGGVLAAPDATFAVYKRTMSEVIVHPELGAPRSYPVPNCSPAAVSRVNVALRCGPTGQVAVLDLAGGAVTPVDTSRVDGQVTFVAGVGRRWIHLGTEKGYPKVAKVLSSESLLDLATGEVVDLAADPYGARRVLDLDSASPSRPSAAARGVLRRRPSCSGSASPPRRRSAAGCWRSALTRRAP